MATSNVLTAEVTIRGTRALLQHHFGPEALPLEKKERTGVAGNQPSEWRDTAMVTPAGQLYLPGSYAFGCLRDGARYTKKGRGSIQSAVSATLQVTEEQILLDRWLPGGQPGQIIDLRTIEAPICGEVYVDVRGVTNPSTKGKNVRYRLATTAGWTATFHIEWDKTVVSRSEMESVCIDAGKLCGLGSGRSIGYGRFEIVSFKIND